jgi:hypothetical protein
MTDMRAQDEVWVNACSPRFSEVGRTWGTVEPPTPVFSEFFLTPDLRAVREEAPDFSSSLPTEAEREGGSQPRIIDAARYAGSGFSTSSGSSPRSFRNTIKRPLRPAWRSASARHKDRNP